MASLRRREQTRPTTKEELGQNYCELARLHSSRVLAKSRQAIEFLYGPSEYLALGVIEGASWHGKGANGEQQAFVALPPQDIKAGDVALSKVPFLAMRND